jgi:GNAT superfamily N-acetyltransferase
MGRICSAPVRRNDRGWAAPDDAVIDPIIDPPIDPAGETTMVSSIAVGDAVLHVRQLGAGDVRAIAQHLLVLGLPDRRSRFLGNLADAAVCDYARRLDPSRAILIGAFDAERLVGLAEAHPTDTVGKVEVAVSIDAAFRRRGLGRRLVARALTLAFGHGAQSAEFNYAPDNRPFIFLLRAIGGRFGPKLGYASIARSNEASSAKGA